MKIFKLCVTLAVLSAALFLSTGCKLAEDGEDGTSATALILSQTGNKWYEYNKDSSDPTTPTGTSGSTSEDLADIYIFYRTSDKKLVMAACGSTLYATTSKELSAEQWAASAVTLRVAGKISSVNGDPTAGKTAINDFTSWGNFTIGALIEKLFDI